MISCRWRNRAQGGARRRPCSLRCFVSSWSVVEPSRNIRGSVAFGVVFFYFGFVVGPCVYLDDVMLYSWFVWSGDCKPPMYLFSYSVHGLCEDCLTCDIAYNAVMPLSRVRHVGDIAASWAWQVGIRAFPDLGAPLLDRIVGVVESRIFFESFRIIYIGE